MSDSSEMKLGVVVIGALVLSLGVLSILIKSCDMEETKRQCLKDGKHTVEQCAKL